MEDKEAIRELLDEVKKSAVLVLVEGVKDKRALEELGITNVMVLKRPLFAVVEDIASKVEEVVLLTDLDEEGKKLYARLSRDLQHHGVKIDNRLRDALFKSELRHVEGLVSYLG